MNINPTPLSIEPLAAESFALFGDVIQTEGRDCFPINQGSTQRYHDLAKIDVSAEGGFPIVSIFRAKPLSFPLIVRMMERHPLGSQAFIPMEEHPFLIIVAPSGEFNSNALRCFLTCGQQGVNYHRNVWHHPIIALENISDFLVIDRGGDGHNCDEHRVPEDQQRFVKLKI